MITVLNSGKEHNKKQLASFYIFCLLRYLLGGSTELFKMVCEPNETDVSIGIPSVMLPQDAGETFEKYMKNNSVGKYICCPYFPFLWSPYSTLEDRDGKR